MQLTGTILFGLFNTLIVIIAPIGNACLLYAILSKKKHRELVSNTYLITLAITDLLASVIIGPYNLLSLNLPEYSACLAEKYSEPCKAGNFFVYTIGINRILALTLMSLDRYFAILHPFLYQRFINRRRAVAMNVFIVFQSCVTNLPMSLIPGWVNYDGKPGAPCGFLWDRKLPYLVPYAILNFCIPLTVLVFSNTKVFFVARKQRRQILSMQRKEQCSNSGGAFGIPSSVTNFPAAAVESPEENENDLTKNSCFLDVKSAQKPQNMPHIKSKFDSKYPEKVSETIVRGKSSFPNAKCQNSKNFHSLVEGDLLEDSFQLENEIKPKELGNASEIKNRTSLSLKKQNLVSGNFENDDSRSFANTSTACSSATTTTCHLNEIKESKNENNVEDFCILSNKDGKGNLCNVQKNTSEKARKAQKPMIHAQDIIITFSTIVIVILFFTSWLPFAISRIIFVIDRRLFSWHTVVWTATLTLVSAAGNPLIVLGTRRDLRKTIKKRCKIGECSLAT